MYRVIYCAWAGGLDYFDILCILSIDLCPCACSWRPGSSHLAFTVHKWPREKVSGSPMAPTLWVTYTRGTAPKSFLCDLPLRGTRGLSFTISIHVKVVLHSRMFMFAFDFIKLHVFPLLVFLCFALFCFVVWNQQSVPDLRFKGTRADGALGYISQSA